MKITLSSTYNNPAAQRLTLGQPMPIDSVPGVTLDHYGYSTEYVVREVTNGHGTRVGFVGYNKMHPRERLFWYRNGVLFSGFESSYEAVVNRAVRDAWLQLAEQTQPI